MEHSPPRSWGHWTVVLACSETNSAFLCYGTVHSVSRLWDSGGYSKNKVLTSSCSSPQLETQTRQYLFTQNPPQLDFDDPHSTFCTDLQMLFYDRLWKSTFYCPQSSPTPFPAPRLQCQPAHDINSWVLPWLGSESNLVNSPPVQLVLETDASKSGWGAYRNLVKYKVLVGNGWSFCNQEKTKADLLLGEPWR